MIKKGLAAALLALLGLAAIVGTSKFLMDREYKSPALTPPGQTAETPRDRGLADQRAEQEKADKEKPYQEAEYRPFPKVGSRVAVWVAAQLHLLFAAFVLAVPLFALIIEFIGYRTKDPRYDRLAHEFTKLLSVSFSLTATFGAMLTFGLIILYPKFTNYLVSVFSPTFLPYVGLFFFEAFFLYTYYYGWGKFSPRVHLLLGLGLNVVGTAIMLIANAWLTFMTSPSGISETGALISTWDAVRNFTWMPINIHRIIANVAFGGSVAAAYAAFKFLGAKTDEERDIRARDHKDQTRADSPLARARDALLLDTTSLTPEEVLQVMRQALYHLGAPALSRLSGQNILTDFPIKQHQFSVNRQGSSLLDGMNSAFQVGQPVGIAVWRCG